MTHSNVLKQFFGYDDFREGQEHLIESILNGKDSLGIMPTGAGKSLCFQVPAIMMTGITLVISPLISLMKDQVNALTQAGVKAAFINSSLTEKQINLVLNKAINNEYKLIYVAPERLLSYGFLEFVKRINISMLTVDEAHCISQWGQDFRPSYAKIPEFLSYLNYRPIVSAFTATATARVREDIISLLCLNTPTVLVTGFNRENLYFEVQKPKDKLLTLTNFLLDRKDKSGVIYCSTKKNVDMICEKLNGNGFNATRYHTGIDDNERHSNQDDFIYDKVQIMVATNAFGMGIDKSNVSFVVHYNIPKDIESYYQEAGRAGRDGSDAECLLLYNGQDVVTQTWFIENSNDEQDIDPLLIEELKIRKRKRLREMTFYATTNDCLRSYILKYFGENPPNFCGNCSSCNEDFDTTDITIDVKKIISCVKRMKERFGIKLIIDVLRGSKGERITSLELDKLSTYNISEKSETQLRDIINYLILNDYLIKTDAEYPIIILGERAREALYGKDIIKMKLSKDIEKKSKPKKDIMNSKEIVEIDNELLAKLKALRFKLATIQKVPAFVIFSDSTLIDMCIKLPKNKDEMLDVTGVGNIKYERYGEEFLEILLDFTPQPEIHQEDTTTANRFFDKSTIETSEEYITISIIADKINSQTMIFGYNKISGVKINDWLMSVGYLERIVENESNYKVPTQQGIDLGIKNEEKTIRGKNSRINLFSRTAQEFIIQNIMDILEFNSL